MFYLTVCKEKLNCWSFRQKFPFILGLEKRYYSLIWNRFIFIRGFVVYVNNKQDYVIIWGIISPIVGSFINFLHSRAFGRIISIKADLTVVHVYSSARIKLYDNITCHNGIYRSSEFSEVILIQENFIFILGCEKSVIGEFVYFPRAKLIGTIVYKWAPCLAKVKLFCSKKYKKRLLLTDLVFSLPTCLLYNKYFDIKD